MCYSYVMNRIKARIDIRPTPRGFWSAAITSEDGRYYFADIRSRRMTDEEVLEKFGPSKKYGDFDGRKGAFMPRRLYTSVEDVLSSSRDYFQEKVLSIEGLEIDATPEVTVWDNQAEGDAFVRSQVKKHSARIYNDIRRKEDGIFWMLKSEKNT